MFDHLFLESVPLYAVGALGGAEKKELEEHLSDGCPVCESELLVYSETVSRFPFALPSVQPLPPEMREKVRKRLQALEIPDTPAAPRASYGIAVAVAALVVVGAFLWRQQSGELKRQSMQIAKLRQQLHQQIEQNDWLRDPAVQLAMLSGVQLAPEAKGKMVWNPVHYCGMFYANSLPALAPEKSYQLWVIGNQGPVSAAVFAPNQQGAAVVHVSRLSARPDGSLQFAVTIEPVGGVPQPTGPMLLSGKPL